ncbi:hypothetical protein EDB89DRAFT_2009762 [Lactarius sanguifluus]|nr:hypothetical protein EDB89DRAFT_2009762 [Lactarius sanguifluus]
MIPTYVKWSLGQRSARRWSCPKRRRLESWRKRATENNTFWNEWSAASSVVAHVNLSMGGRRPMARAKRRCNSHSDVVLRRGGTSAEDEECFGIFRGDLGTTRDVWAEYGRTPASSLIRCKESRVLIFGVFRMRSCPNAMARYDDKVVEARRWRPRRK